MHSAIAFPTKQAKQWLKQEKIAKHNTIHVILNCVIFRQKT